MTPYGDDVEYWEAYRQRCEPSRRERVTEILIALGALLCVVAFYGAIVLIAWSRGNYTDTGTGTEPQHHCRYDPRYGDDC